MKKLNRNKLPRIHKITLMLNEEEMKTIDYYVKKYKIQSKSRLYREAIMSHVIKTLVDDYPTLFNENDMR